jgi:TolB-like protein
MATQSYVFGPFRLDAERGILFRDGGVVALGSRAFAVLHALVSAEGRVVTKSELMSAGWPKSVVEESNLSVQIAVLRKLLGPSPDGGDWIATVSRIGYRFIGDKRLASGPAEGAIGAPPEAAARKTSIVVLPFVNLSRDLDQEYFADGITEDVIMALSRFRWFLVIARNTSFAYKGKVVDVRQVARELGVAYVLEGSVRRSAERVRISAQLVDGETGGPVWADRYDFDLVDMLSVQDRIAEQVAGAIEPAMLKTESRHSAEHRAERDFSGWDLVRQGTWYFHQLTRATHWRARELFREAKRADDELPDAHAWIARVSSGMVAYGWSDDPKVDLREGVDAAMRAIHLDEQNPYGHYGLAVTSIHSDDLERATRAVTRAIDLSPSFALGYIVLGMARLFSGRPEEAIEPMQHGFRLNPYDPQNFVWYNLLTLAQFCAGHYEAALASIVKAAQSRPTWRPTYIKMACCHLALGQVEQARACLNQPGLEDSPADGLGPFNRLQPELAERMRAMLRDAGLNRTP